jgi:hypothetical protein
MVILFRSTVFDTSSLSLRFVKGAISMNPFDILTEILNAGAQQQQQQQKQQQPQGGGQRRGGPSGVDILKDILGGGPASGSSSGGVQFPGVLKEGRGNAKTPSASELEDMLGVGNKAPSQPTQQRQPAPSGNAGGQGDIFGQQQPKQSPPQLSQAEQEQMVVLIRAMIYAGKADGSVTPMNRPFSFCVKSSQTQQASAISLGRSPWVWKLPSMLPRSRRSMSIPRKKSSICVN